MRDSIALREEWVDHRFFRYRGCAPDPVDPTRMAGDPSLPVGGHHGPDAFASESQAERLAREAKAVEVCLSCPVMVQCDAYASSVTADGRLAEPDGVWGGRRALERHKALIAARHAAPAAPDRRFATPQKRAVLKAFAAVWEPFAVAAAAGVDVRTANWQRSNLVTLLGLPRTASRGQVLEAARERGLLDGVVVVADDGTVPAVAPPTRMPTAVPSVSPVAAADTSAAAVPAPTTAGAVALPPPGPHVPVRGVPSPRRTWFADIAGQLDLFEAELDDLAAVHDLFTDNSEPMEAAA